MTGTTLYQYDLNGHLLEESDGQDGTSRVGGTSTGIGKPAVQSSFGTSRGAL